MNKSDNNIYTTPYTYLIGWSKLGLWYYGVRYALGCDPSDLWVTYFTSSQYVSEVRKTNGDPDVIQVRKVFRSAESAQNWEFKVLTRLKAGSSNKWINKGTHKLFHKGDGETSAKISLKTKEAMKDPALRKHLSDSAKRRGIQRICCIVCKNEIDIANFKRHTDSHYGIKVIYINNGISQKRISNTDAIPEGWQTGRLPLPKEALEKISKANTGKKRSVPSTLIGVKKSQLHRDKMSLAAKHRKLITNGVIRKWIYTDQPIPVGWVLVNP